MNNFSNKTIGEIVAQNYRTAQVFRSFGLDFCCGGKRTLQGACSQKNIDVNKVEAELEIIRETGTDGHNYNNWTVDFLVDYIVNNHHSFVRSKLPEINFYAEKVARVHGDRHPELLEILQHVRTLTDEMMQHLEKEEQELFPAIKTLKTRNGSTSSVESALLEALEEEHDKAGSIMSSIEELSNGFTPPEDACASYRVLFQNLEGFQRDLHKHVHLENNILFPKALALEIA